jgi:hypothetical protein
MRSDVASGSIGWMDSDAFMFPGDGGRRSARSTAGMSTATAQRNPR